MTTMRFMCPTESACRQRHIGDPGVRKPRVRVDGRIPNANGDSVARLHTLSHEGFNVGIGTIQVDDFVAMAHISTDTFRYFFSVLSPGWCGVAPLPNFPIPLVPGEAAQIQGGMGLDAGLGLCLGTCREEPQRSKSQRAGRPLPASKQRLQQGGSGCWVRLQPPLG